MTGGIIIPLIQMNSRMVLSLFLGLSIFIYDPIVASIGVVTFAIAYFTFFKLFKRRLQLNGRIISETNEKRFRLMNDSFGGIKEVLFLGRDSYFIKIFNKKGRSLSYSRATNQVLAQVPRYFLELMAFGSMIALLLYLIASYNGNLGIILPIISVYAFVAFKLIPAFHQIYGYLAEIKGNIAAFETIKQDLIDSQKTKLMILKHNQDILYPKKQILLNNLTFTYPNAEKKLLAN